MKLFKAGTRGGEQGKEESLAAFCPPSVSVVNVVPCGSVSKGVAGGLQCI